MKNPGILLILLASALPCLASLEWSTTDLTLKTAVGQARAVAVYRFRNSGDRPVHIVSLDPSCECMAAQPGKAVYAPGETGEIRVEVSLAGYSGRLRRSLAVETDDPDHRYTDLTLTIDVPEPVSISPRFLYWRVGEPPAAKRLQIIVADPAAVSLGGTVSENPAFRVRLTDEGRGRYWLTVQPKDTREAIDAPIRLKASIGGRAQVYIVYAAVKQP